MIRLTDDTGTLRWKTFRWLVAYAFFGCMLGGRGYEAWKNFEDPKRPWGNNGHTMIDFGGQYMMGRLLIEGHGQHLYRMETHRRFAEERFPIEHEDPEATRHDADRLVGWYPVSDDNVIAGPLYPPVHAFMMAPIALIPDTRVAYRVWQALLLLSFIGIGLAVRSFTNDSWWWPMAAGVLLAFPGARAGLDLAQNSSLTLLLLCVGWAMRTKNRPWLAGVIWGFIAYKPTWALSFVGALLILREWRMLAGMTLTGLGLITITLPVVGVNCWKEWLIVGKLAAEIYNLDENWIFLSRDVFGIPRRFMLDFSMSYDSGRNDRTSIALIGWLTWAFIFVTTVFIVWRRKWECHTNGPGPAMVFFAMWLCAYRFMYYDTLIAGFGVMVLVSRPGAFIRLSSWPISNWGTVFVLLLFVIENTITPIGFRFTVVADRYNRTFVAELSDRYPLDTLAIFCLWAWCVRTIWFQWDRDYQPVESPQIR